MDGKSFSKVIFPFPQCRLWNAWARPGFSARVFYWRIVYGSAPVSRLSHGCPARSSCFPSPNGRNAPCPLRNGSHPSPYPLPHDAVAPARARRFPAPAHVRRGGSGSIARRLPPRCAKGRAGRPHHSDRRRQLHFPSGIALHPPAQAQPLLRADETGRTRSRNHPSGRRGKPPHHSAGSTSGRLRRACAFRPPRPETRTPD